MEARHAISRRCDQRNMSDTHSALAALISNISERDRAKDVEQFDDILRTLINEANKFENRFGTIRDEEKILAVKKLMRESLMYLRFLGATMSYEELLIVLEKIIIDKNVPTARKRNIDTSASMKIGMAAQDDGDKLREEGGQRIVDLALQAVYKGTGKGTLSFGKGQNWNEKAKVQIREEGTLGRRAVARKEAKKERKVARETTQHVGFAVKQDTLQHGVERAATNICTPVMKMTVNMLKKYLTVMKSCKRGVCFVGRR